MIERWVNGGLEESTGFLVILVGIDSIAMNVSGLISPQASLLVALSNRSQVATNLCKNQQK